MSRVSLCAKTRRLVNKREQVCGICGNSETLEAHHIDPMYKQGPDEADNIILLCEGCHRFAPDSKELFAEYRKDKNKYILNKLSNMKLFKDLGMELVPNTESIFNKALETYCKTYRKNISEKTKEGLKRGKPGGRPQKIGIDKKKVIIELYNKKETSVTYICKMFGISRPTLYKIVKE